MSKKRIIALGVLLFIAFLIGYNVWYNLCYLQPAGAGPVAIARVPLGPGVENKENIENVNGSIYFPPRLAPRPPIIAHFME